jgi:hypothetical protein
MADGTQLHEFFWQRRMGVEPTRGRAERPPSRFEDGETHRGPYTSMFVWEYFAIQLDTCQAWLSTFAKCLHALNVYFCKIFYHQISFV